MLSNPSSWRCYESEVGYYLLYLLCNFIMKGALIIVLGDKDILALCYSSALLCFLNVKQARC